MASSAALEQFKESLQMAVELIKIEEDYNDPPSYDEQKAVQGLRGGAAVLMVASWEDFLGRLVEEELTSLITHNPKIPFKDLPLEMQTHNVIKTLEPAMKDANKTNKLPDIEKACQFVIDGKFNPALFSDTRSNPSPKRIREMFNNLGIDDIFVCIRGDFEVEWDKEESITFINDKLGEIMQRRHVVAHKADALKISRSDLNNYIKFMKIIATLFEKQLRHHMDNIIGDKRE